MTKRKVSLNQEVLHTLGEIRIKFTEPYLSQEKGRSKPLKPSGINQSWHLLLDKSKQIIHHDSFTEKAQPHCFSLLPLTSGLGSFKNFVFILRGMSSNFADSSNNQKPVLKFLDCSLRLSVIPLSVATIWLTVTNKEDNSIYGEVKFSNLLGLKYMVCISAICAGYAFFAALASWIRCLVTKAWLFFVSDQIVAYLMVISGATVMEILYLAYNGDQKITWSEACSTYGKFCNKMKVALVLHALVLCCFIVLAVISAYRVLSLFEPPFSSKEVEEERT